MLAHLSCSSAAMTTHPEPTQPMSACLIVAPQRALHTNGERIVRHDFSWLERVPTQKCVSCTPDRGLLALAASASSFQSAVSLVPCMQC